MLLPLASEGCGRYCFYRCVSVHTWGGVPQSKVLFQVTNPRSFLEGTPVPGSFSGHWSQVLSQVYPNPGQEGTPQVRWGTPWPGLRYPPPLDRTAERALATQWAVCLLHSCRTFLFQFVSLQLGGGGVPQSQVLSQVTGPKSFLGGVPQSWLGVLQSWRYLSPGQGDTPVMGTPSQDRTGVPLPVRSGWGTPTPPPSPKTEQQSEHLLPGGRYASCCSRRFTFLLTTDVFTRHFICFVNDLYISLDDLCLYITLEFKCHNKTVKEKTHTPLFVSL